MERGLLVACLWPDFLSLSSLLVIVSLYLLLLSLHFTLNTLLRIIPSHPFPPLHRLSTYFHLLPSMSSTSPPISTYLCINTPLLFVFLASIPQGEQRLHQTGKWCKTRQPMQQRLILWDLLGWNLLSSHKTMEGQQEAFMRNKAENYMGKDHYTAPLCLYLGIGQHNRNNATPSWLVRPGIIFTRVP